VGWFLIFYVLFGISSLYFFLEKTADSWWGVWWSKIHFLKKILCIATGFLAPLGNRWLFCLIFPGDVGVCPVSGTDEVVPTSTASVEGTVEASDSLLSLDGIGTVNGTEVCGYKSFLLSIWDIEEVMWPPLQSLHLTRSFWNFPSCHVHHNWS
jgi:hypothetical protein